MTIEEQIYKDALSPAMQEFGNEIRPSGKIIGSLVNDVITGTCKMVTVPISWIKEFRFSLDTKMTNVPDTERIEPKLGYMATLELLNSAGAACMDKNVAVREMFANLLADSMDKRTAGNAHPSFVSIIKQLTTDEAKLIRYCSNDEAWPLLNIVLENETVALGIRPLYRHLSLLGDNNQANCEFKQNVPMYLDNLERLGLVCLNDHECITNPNSYDLLEAHPLVSEYRFKYEKTGAKISTRKAVMYWTNYGRKFCESCIVNHEDKVLP